MGAKEPVVLLTGASSGIGLALARRLSRESRFRTVITARKNSLSRFSESSIVECDRFLIRPLDITSIAERNDLIKEVSERWGGVDILINNAGISYRAVVEHMTDEDEIKQLDTNYLGPMALTRMVLPRMRAQRWGRILNVSSVGGMMAMPTMGSYSASKFALEGASEALYYELRPWNVKVTLLQPGFIHSNSFRHVYWTKASQSALTEQGDYQVYYQRMGAFIEDLMEKALATPDSVAGQMMKLLDDPDPPLRVPATVDAYFFSMLRRLLPRRFYHHVLYKNLPGIRYWGQSDQNK